MGFYLDSVFPNTFREHYKAKWLKEYTLNKPKFYLRYINDIQAAFGKEEHSLH